MRIRVFQTTLTEKHKFALFQKDFQNVEQTFGLAILKTILNDILDFALRWAESFLHFKRIPRSRL